LNTKVLFEGDSQERENRLPVFFICSLLASSFWSTALVELFAALLVISWMVHRVKSGEILRSHGSFWNPPLDVTKISLSCWLLYVICIIISIICSPVPESSVDFLNKLWHAVLFPIVLSLRISTRDLIRIARVFTISACGAALLAIVLFVLRGLSDVQWPFIGETTFAILMTLSWLLVLGILSTQDNHSEVAASRKYADIVTGVPIVAAVFLSAMKAPVVLAVAGTLVIALIIRSRVALLSISLLIIMAFISPHTLWMKVQWIVGGNAIDRYIIWRSGKDLLASIPLFGYGPDSYARLLPASAKAAILHKLPSSWHNDFLQTILESGWITGIAYIACVSAVMYGALVALHNSREAGRKTELTAFTIVLGALIAFSAVNAVISSAVLGATFWLLLGLTANISREEGSHG
jgi:O-antigen ligase